MLQKGFSGIHRGVFRAMAAEGLFVGRGRESDAGAVASEFDEFFKAADLGVDGLTV